MTHIVYETTCLIDGMTYVGVVSKTRRGFKQYLGSGVYLTRAIQKYGKENFVRRTLHEVPDVELAYLIEELIVDDEFIDPKLHYNLMPGGKGGSNGPHTEETKRQMSISARSREPNIKKGHVFGPMSEEEKQTRRGASNRYWAKKWGVMSNARGCDVRRTKQTSRMCVRYNRN